MRTKLIISSIILTILNYSVSSSHYQNIGDCHYYDAEFAGSCNLTLICIASVQENNFFESNTASVCPSSSHSFEKVWIGTLNFENCELSKLPDHAIFEIYYNVHTLTVSHLGLTALHPENFVKSKNLTTLIASHNKIVSIPSKLFWESPNLYDVDFSVNEITQIDPNAFPVNNHIQILNLAFNKISDLSVQTFQKLLELKQLLLTHNQIANIPPFLFHNSQNLVHVDFSFNKIMKIEEFAFFGDVNLEKLNLTHNSITEFYKQIIENHSYLKDLDISWNKITEVEADTFRSLQNLVILDVSGNLLGKIDNRTFSTLIKLQQLNLSHTALSEMQPGTFSHQINLHTLDLSSNHIKLLNSNILPSQLDQLIQLRVEHNQLRELNGFVSSSFTKIVGVVGSKFECSFLDKGAEVITWNRLETVSRPMKCSFLDGNTDFNGRESFENRSNGALQEEDTEAESSQHTKEASNEKIVNYIDRNCKEDQTKAANQLLIMTWINTVGLITIAVGLIWLVLRWRTLNQDNFSSISYRKNDIVLLEGTECST